MELTAHAALRIQDRTNMVAKDVLSIIENGAVVSLGSVDNHEYLLFYSPLDWVCKVAITSENRSRLISVWGVNFVFPKGVSKITSKRRKKAALAVREFLFSRIPRVPKPEKELVCRLARYVVKIEVLVGAKVEYVHEIGTIPVNAGRKFGKIVHTFHDDLKTITAVVAANSERIDSLSVTYNISCWRQSTLLKQYHLTHHNLVGYLRGASP